MANFGWTAYGSQPWTVLARLDCMGVPHQEPSQVLALLLLPLPAVSPCGACIAYPSSCTNSA